jgi:hypothetical protein
MMPTSSSLTTSFITTSFMLGFSRRCASREGLAPFSRWIRCIHMDGSIPFRSAIVHIMASLCSFSTSNRLSSWSFCKSDAIMTGRVFLAPRHICKFFWQGLQLKLRWGTQERAQEECLMSKAGVLLVVSMGENLHWLLALANHGPFQCTGPC